MTINPEVSEFAQIIGTELGLLVKLARHPNSTTQDVLDMVKELPIEDVRSVLFAAVLVLGQGAVIE